MRDAPLSPHAVGLSTVPTTPGAAGKLLLKMLAEKREKEAAEMRRGSREATCFVQCSSKPDKGYSMMMGIIDDTATVYEIKAFNGAGSGLAKPVSIRWNTSTNIQGVSPCCM